MKSSPYMGPLDGLRKQAQWLCRGRRRGVQTDCRRLRLLLLLAAGCWVLGRLYWLPAAQLPAAVNRHSQIND